MNTELGFLMDLFLDDEVPKNIKKKIAERIKEVEQSFASASVSRGTFSLPAADSVHPGFTYGSAIVTTQVPSMQGIMQKHPDLIPKPPVPVTPAAAQALAERQALILNASNEKPEDGRKSPRKI